ncbi:YraN family protein [Enterobacteriaceae bacterium H11S18]|uniref:YraN family protein n=1 Tax=Enterobacteriaceae TaxID=543 RepID=UPI001929627F|nr:MULTISPECIES: YraN family protein [Enterobacteriaceae]MCT4707866.1 YraN family protein [Dryocola clanedunensis]MCT4711258.1 YraN family protein [Dryocola clanedunensis]
MAEILSGSNHPGQLSRQQAGAHYELQARRFLERKGLRFIAANVHQRGGEIDLIMKQHNVIVFVEVRYRRSNRFGDAAASVTRNKQQKLLRAAQNWLARTSGSFDTVDCRFDVVAFTGNEIEWLTNAFTADV